MSKHNSIIKRQLPDSICKQDFEESLVALTDFIGEEWLADNKNNANLLRQLWMRQDYLASIELYTLGLALSRIIEVASVPWLQDLKQQLMSKRESDVRGIANELLMSFYFSEHHKISLPEPNQEAYDAIISSAENEILISCKKMDQSDIEKKFNHFSNKLYFKLEEYINNKSIKDIQIILLEKNIVGLLDVDKFFKVITGLVINKKNHFLFKGVEITIGYNTGGMNHHRFAFMTFFKINDIEMKRLNNLFSKAAKKFKKISCLDTQQLAIWIALPHKIDLEEAREYIQERLHNLYKTIDYVFLFKYLPVLDIKTNNNYPHMEMGMCINMNRGYNPISNFKDKHGILLMKLPVGSTSKESPYDTLMSESGPLLSLKDYYCFQKGYDRKINSKDECSGEISNIFGIKSSIVIGDIEICPIVPEKQEFIIL